jgi:hypothetical protein
MRRWMERVRRNMKRLGKELRTMGFTVLVREGLMGLEER